MTKRHIPFLFLAFFFTGGLLKGERLLKVKPRETPKVSEENKITHSDVTEEEERSARISRFHATTVSLQILSPLIDEVFPEKRFRAWGNYVSASFFLKDLTDRLNLQLEAGAGVSLIRLSLSQPAVDFSHLFVLFPVRGRILYEVNEKFFMEGFLGLLFRPWEYDSRDTPDGGFHRNENDWIKLDVGVGGGVFINDNLLARMSLGLQWLTLGLGIVL